MDKPMELTAPRLEAEIHRIGQDLARRSTGHTPTVFNARWWSGTLLDWCMKDEHFKVQLFRFIDVLPALKRDDLIARLVEEYFGGAQSPASPLHWGLRAISGTRIGAYLSAKSLRHQIHQMAYTFIAGATVQEALPVLAKMWSRGVGYSVDLLGEATVSEREADQYRDRCIEALTVFGEAAAGWPAMAKLERDHLGTIPRVHLSVKLSALYSQLDPIDPEGSYHAVAGRLRPIMDLAASLPAAITFDMEQAETKDLTLMIFKRLLAEDAYSEYPHGGIAIQAYLKDSAGDLESLVHWCRQRRAPITVRLVKGAYWDADTIRYQERGWPVPVFEQKHDTDANYEAMSRRLVQYPDLIRPAFGTHNIRSVAHAQAVAEEAGLPPEAVEYQMIFGMAEPLQAAVADTGRRLRIYSPVGEILPGMAYLVRRLLENTSNESFLRQEYVDSKPLEQLLAPPHRSEPESGGRIAGEVKAESPTGNGRASRSTKVAEKATDSPGEGRKGAVSEESADNGSNGTSELPERRERLAPRFINEPPTDFAREEARAGMREAIETVRRQLGKTLRVSSPDGLSPSAPELVSVDPSLPERVVGRVPTYSPSDVDRLAESALAAYPSWSQRPPEERAEVLTRTAGLMRNERFELAAWEVFETGKPWREADADVAEAIDFLEFYAAQMRRLGTPLRLGLEPGELNHLHYSPRGLAVVIAPWNFPLAIPTGLVSAAVVTGNVVLFKPSERSPMMGAHLIRLLEKAGLPEGVARFAPGGPDLGRALVGQRDVQVIAFTGSKDVGLQILARSAEVQPGQRFVRRVIAEMGGKNAVIVDDTADLDEAVTGVVSSFTGFQGQKCSACSRAIVLDSVYDTFLRRLREAVMSLRIGPPEDPNNRMGPMIDERARQKVEDYVEIGKREGRLVVGREVVGPGYFAGPSVFAEIQPEHRLAREEIFGPVLAVMRAKDFDDALRLANSSDYALTGGLYSRSPANITAACQALDVGNLYINRPITGSLVGRQPFGGHRLSGVGAKAGGEEYLVQFMVARVISENTLRRGFAPSV